MLNRTRLLMTLISAGILFSGCAIERKFIDNENRDYGAPVNLDQRIALVLDSSYSNVQIDDGNYVHLFGDAIANGTEDAFRNVFRKVGRLDQYPSPSNDHWDFVAVPKIVDFDYSGGAWRWNDHINVISVEWSLEDGKDNVIWVKTVKGSGISTHSFDSEERMNGFKRMFDEYYKNLRTALIDAGQLLAEKDK